MVKVSHTIKLYVIIIVVFTKSIYAQQKKDSLYLDSIFKKAVTLLQKDPKEATTLSLKLKHKAKELQVISKVMSANNCLAMINYFQGKHEASRVFYFENEKLGLEINDPDAFGTNYFNLATSYFAEGKNQKTTKYCLEALKYLKKSDHIKVLAHQQLAEVYSVYLQYDKAIETLLDALKVFEEKDFYIKNIDKNLLKAKILTVLGRTYFNIGNYERALFYYDKTETLLTKTPENFKRGVIYLDKVNLNQSLSEYYLFFKEYDKALSYALLSKKMIELYNLEIVKPAVFLRLGEVYLAKKEVEKAKIYFKRTRESLNKVEDKVVEVTLLKNMSKLHAEKNEFHKALSYIDSYIKITDSIASQKNASVHSDMVISYEDELKNSKLNEQKLTIEKQNTALLKVNQKYISVFIGVSIVIVVLIILLFMFRNKQRIKQQEIKHINVENELSRYGFIIEGEEKARIRLAQELHDGLNNDLAAIKFLTTSVTKEDLDENIKKEFNKVLGDLDTSIEQIRDISHNLAPPSFRKKDFMTALKLFCNQVLDTNKVKLSFKQSGDELIFNKNIETAIYRILQELIGAISKKELINLLHIDFYNENEIIKIEIKEDGVDLLELDEEFNTDLILWKRLRFLKANLKTERKNKLNYYCINFKQNKIVERRAS